MRILLLSYWYHPEPVAKPHDLATELVARGHDVTVVTGFPNYPEGRLYDGYRQAPYQWQDLDGVRVLRLPVFIDRSRSSKRRVLSYLSYGLAASTLGLAMTKRPDVVWCYQIGLPGVAHSRLRGVPFVHEVQDLWPEWGRSTEMGMKNGLYEVLDRQEKFIYGQARHIITISNGFKERLVEKGVPREKITILPNWANESNFRPVEPDERLGVAEGLKGRFNVVYGGNVGTHQALDVVLATAERLADLPDVQFVIIGDGVDRERLEREAKQRNLRNVRFLGKRPPEQMAGYLAWADALFIHLRKDPVYEITIPSKTYSYLATGRPVLAAVSGDVAELIRKHGAGLVCPEEDPEALAANVRRLYAMPNEAREALGRAGREAFLNHYTRPVLVSHYEEIFERMIASRAGGRRNGHA